MNLRSAAIIVAIMIGVLAAAKFAGNRMSPDQSISPRRVALVTARITPVQSGFWVTVMTPLAEQLDALEGVTPVVVGTPVADLGPDRLRQVRFNYQSGTIMVGRAQTSGEDTTVTWGLTDAEGNVVWSTTGPVNDYRGGPTLTAVADSILTYVNARAGGPPQR